MNVLIAEKCIGGIPVLHFHQQVEDLSSLPIVFLFHRFTASREMDANLGYMLARAGFSVICPEAEMHGSQYNGDSVARARSFWDILLATLDSLPLLYEGCLTSCFGNPDNITVFGTSMGGFVALSALANFDFIRGAACYMSTGFFYKAVTHIHPPVRIPDLTKLTRYDITDKLDRFKDKPLFLWHGQKDDVVPCRETENLYESMISSGLTNDFECVIDSSAGHKVTQESIELGVSFLKRNFI